MSARKDKARGRDRQPRKGPPSKGSGCAQPRVPLAAGGSSESLSGRDSVSDGVAGVSDRWAASHDSVSDAAARDRRERLRREDAEARRIARSEFERPLLLEAGAGTGKTQVLVERVVAWCVGPGWERAERELVDEGITSEGPASAARVAERVLAGVVAVTFTEAAAAEMEERIAATLLEVAEGRKGALDLLPGSAPAEEGRARARALLGAFDRLVVRTIHGLCRRILAEHPLEAGLHPRFVVDASGREREAAVGEAVESDLAGQLERPEGGGWLPLLEAGIGPDRVQEWVQGLLENGVEAADFASAPLAPERLAELEEALERACRRLAAAASALASLPPRQLGPRVLQAAKQSVVVLGDRPVSGRERAERWSRLLAELWEERLIRQLGRWERGELGKGESKRLDEEERRELAAAAGELRSLLGFVAKSWKPALLAAVHPVLSRILADAERRLHARGAVGFATLLQATAELLESRPEVASRLRGELRQLLVDEFQDTDPVQCRILGRLALDGDPRARPGLFVVGDPKQSIYAWRGADLAAYEAFRERIVAAGGRVCRLSVSFRSRQEILDEVERCVGGAMHERPGLQPRFEPLVAGGAAPGPAAGEAPAPVEHWLSFASGESGEPDTSGAASRREAEALAADLFERARARGEGGEPRFEGLAVLLRQTGDLDLYLEALRRAAIPYVVDRDRVYSRRREVRDAAALVRAVLDPADTLALVAALRSSWVGVPDAAWLPLWRRGFPGLVREALLGSEGALEAAVRAAAEAEREVAGLGIPGLEPLAGWGRALAYALRVLAALRRSFEHEPADRFLERLRRWTLIEATEASRSLGRFRLANLERFLRELAAWLESGEPTEVVVRRLRSLREDTFEEPSGRPRGSDANAVEVLTIHQAKGRTFDEVYLVQVHKGSRGGSNRGLDAVRRDGHLEYRLPLGGSGAAAGGLATPGFGRFEREQGEVASAESVRTLYVALTRPRHRLVVAGQWGGGRSASKRGSVSHAEILEATRGAAARIARERFEAGGAGGPVEHDGARWRFLAWEKKEAAASAPAAAVASLPELSEVEAEARRIAQLRRAAREREARPLTAAVTETAKHLEELEAFFALRGREEEEGCELPPASGRASFDPALAALAGSAVHRWLERVPWGAADLERAARAELERVKRWIEGSLAGEAAERVVARAEELAERTLAGSLGQRLRELAPHRLAHELDLLAPPEGDGPEEPVGARVGTLDLLYRDPTTGELVVADFKTDRIASPAELAQRVARYAPQARAYAEALRSAFELAERPRVELWFLDLQRIEEVG